MKKGSVAGIVIVIIIVVIGGFALMHHSDNSTKSSTTKTNSSKSVPAVNNAVLSTKTDAQLGQYLADTNGKPLYTYSADTNGVSNCKNGCLSDWPIYEAISTTNLPAGVSTIKSNDNGKLQYTYQGKPLYYFTGDTSGKVSGDNVEGFSVAKPAASTSTPSTNTTPTSGSSYPY